MFVAVISESVIVKVDTAPDATKPVSVALKVESSIVIVYFVVVLIAFFAIIVESLSIISVASLVLPVIAV